MKDREMMPYQLPQKLQKEVARILAVTDPDVLFREMREWVVLNVFQVVRLAAMLRLAEDKGWEIPEDIAHVPVASLRLIAYGQLDPSLFLALLGRPAFFRKAKALPLPDQAKIAQNEPLRVMQNKGDYRMVPALSMTDAEIKQVFDGDRIRNDTEQVGYLLEKEAKPSRSGIPEEGALIRTDLKRRGMMVGDCFVPLQMLIDCAETLIKKGYRKASQKS